MSASPFSVTRSRAAIVAVALAMAFGCWWMLRPGPTPVPAPPVAVAPDPPKADRPPRRRVEPPTPESPPPAEGFDVRIVDSETKKPVVGALVEVWDGTPPPRTATTDADGRARIAGGAPAENALVRVRAPGRVVCQLVVSSADLTGEAPLAVEMHSGTDVEGSVLDEDGRPLVGARIEATTLHDDGAFPEPGMPPLHETTSAADGSFRVEGLPANYRHLLLFSAPRHVTTGVVWRPDDPRVAAKLAPAGLIRGVVRDATGAALPHASVGASPDPPDEEASRTEHGARADESGRYEIDGLPLGHAWRLVARGGETAGSAEGRCDVLDAGRREATCDLTLRPPARIAVVVLDPVGRPLKAAEVRFVADDGRDLSKDTGDDGRCEYEAEAPAKYRVTVDAPAGYATAKVACVAGETAFVTLRLAVGSAVAGVVVDDLGAPIAGAAVTLVSSDQRFHHAITDAAGGFLVAGLRAGAYALSATADDHAVGDTDVVAPQVDVRLTLRRDGRVSLRLRVPDGAPRPGKWEFSIHRVGSARRAYASYLDWSDAASTRPVPPGAWDVQIELDDYVYVSRPVTVVPAETVALGDIVLDPGVTLVGRVVDAKGRGVPEARVECCLRYERAGDDGTFKIEHVSVGSQAVKVESDDFLPATVTHAVTADGAPLVVTLAHGGLLRGVVQDAAGKPVDDVDVVVSRDGAETAQDSPDDHGRFEFRLPPGHCRVAVRRADVALTTKDVTLREGETTEAEFVVTR